MPTCFIIMPISVRKDLVPEYHGGEDHFSHVLRHLFTPAVEKAGFKLIPPKAKGSEMIHGEIITNLQTADLVLCDMSTLNANVFMELGIRTSLNKPICLVRDDKTPFIPFDATVLNHHTYSCALDPWVLESEIPKLADHIVASAKSCAGKNPLWGYFGLTQIASPPESGSDTDKIALLTKQFERLSQAVEQTMEAPRDKLDRVRAEIVDQETRRAVARDPSLSGLSELADDILRQNVLSALRHASLSPLSVALTAPGIVRVLLPVAATAEQHQLFLRGLVLFKVEPERVILTVEGTLSL